MCGICGKLDFTGSPVEKDLLRRMTDALSHRGPDDGGLYVSPPGGVSCGLGHRRLSIIDLSAAGRQPMGNEDRTLWLVFNGEIYNFPSLREELELKGHRFSSRTDSEVILHLFEEEGTAAFGRLEGMFALALWSQKTETLILARDPVGIKPLVYFWDGRRLLFASETKALLADPALPREMDLEALDLYLSLNYIPAPWTIIKKISKLRPGHFVAVQRGGLREERYWEPPFPPAETGDDLEAIKASLFQVVEGAVRGHMLADVPVGAFLSGGIDSSIVVGLMAQSSRQAIKTFSIGYSDMPMFDERAYARQVANLHGTDHTEIVLSAGQIMASIPEVLSCLDEPFGDSSAVPTFVVARETRREVKVALSGDGGDELFAGYRQYRAEAWHRLYLLLPRLIRKGLLEPVVLGLPDSRDNPLAERLRRVKKFVRSAKETFSERVFALNELFSHEAKEDLLGDAFRLPEELGPSLFDAALGPPTGDPISRMLLADLLISLPADMLWKVDTMSMHHGLEVRVPLLDRQVCELAFRIGGKWKIRGGRGKYIFIETFKELLPKSLHNRPKWGFEMPVSRWLKNDLGYLIDEYLGAERLARQGIFRPEAVAALVADLRRGRRDTAWQLWNLIAFQAWYEKNMQ